MNIATGSILSVAPAGNDWVIAFDEGDGTTPTIRPIIGWATVVEAHLNDGSATTCIQPAFLHVDMVWTPNELREHNPAVSGFEIRARVNPGAAAARARLQEWEAAIAPRPAGEVATNPDYRD
ncbi:hypothetical protein ACFW9X_03285 [Streptomyces sp. NPDC059466]|uniref:hypothetical protein n=1 Tax=Streptomyces sp. NPDC059466 TaxID=3346843 RepID=UPI00369FFB2D